MHRTAAILTFCLAAAATLTGCFSGPPRSFTFDPADYPRVFDITRETIRDRRFDLDRVDARAGVISTQLKPTAGLATPADSEQLSLGQEWQDFINDQMREIRVWFRPVVPDPTAPNTASTAAAADLPDIITPRTSPVVTDPDFGPTDTLAASGNPIQLTVEVTIFRRRYPGRQVETEHIAASGRWTSPQLLQRQLYPGVPIPLRRDDELASQIMQDIKQALAEPAE